MSKMKIKHILKRIDGYQKVVIIERTYLDGCTTVFNGSSFDVNKELRKKKIFKIRSASRWVDGIDNGDALVIVYKK